MKESKTSIWSSVARFYNNFHSFRVSLFFRVRIINYPIYINEFDNTYFA